MPNNIAFHFGIHKVKFMAWYKNLLRKYPLPTNRDVPLDMEVLKHFVYRAIIAFAVNIFFAVLIFMFATSTSEYGFLFLCGVMLLSVSYHIAVCAIAIRSIIKEYLLMYTPWMVIFLINVLFFLSNSISDFYVKSVISLYSIALVVFFVFSVLRIKRGE